MSSLKRLEDTFADAKPLAKHVTPAQTVCNYWNYFWTLLPEHLTEEDSIGYSQRVSLIATPPGTLTFDLVDGASPAPGRADDRSGRGRDRPLGRRLLGPPGQRQGLRFPGEFEPDELPILHANPAAPTGQNGKDCQPGQTGYVKGQLLAPGQSRATRPRRLRHPRQPRHHRRLLEERRHPELSDTRVEARQP